MNDIHAVCPSFFYNFDEFKDLVYEFGPYQGRYISNYPNDWATLLEKHFEHFETELTVIQKEKAKQLRLIISKTMLIDNPKLNFDRNHSWTYNVSRILEKNSEQFADVIGDAFDDSHPFKKWVEMSDDFKESRQRSLNYHRSIASYIKMTSALLKISPSANIVDPYFNPSDDWSSSFIKRLFEETANSKCYAIQIFVKRSEVLESFDYGKHKNKGVTLEKFETQLDTIYKYHIPKNKKLIIYLFSQNDNDNEIHDRLFLTIYGGINLGKGFIKPEEKNKRALYTATLIDGGAHKDLVTRYIDNTSKELNKASRGLSVQEITL